MVLVANNRWTHISEKPGNKWVTGIWFRWKGRYHYTVRVKTVLRRDGSPKGLNTHLSLHLRIKVSPYLHVHLAKFISPHLRLLVFCCRQLRIFLKFWRTLTVSCHTAWLRCFLSLCLLVFLIFRFSVGSTDYVRPIPDNKLSCQYFNVN